MHLDNLTYQARLASYGEFDFAVPFDWLMKDPARNRNHLWFYPHGKAKRGSSFGRPLAWKVIARIALRNILRDGIGARPDSYHSLDDLLGAFAAAYPGKPLRADVRRIALDYMRRYLCTDPADLRGLDYVLKSYGIPCRFSDIKFV